MERRIYDGKIEAGKEDGKPVIFGYGAVFNRDSEPLYSREIGEFIEQIERNAFNKVVNDPRTVVLANHDANLILGRVGSKTGFVGVDDTGYWYKAFPPESRMDIWESVERGDYPGSSFGFELESEDWLVSEGDIPRRSIQVISRVYDAGPVVFPAYPDTSTAARNYRSFIDNIRKEKGEGYNNLYQYKVRLYKHSIII